ncbi:MAG: hypothetical protein J5884_03765 [Paludibacteraceae bacterium]|nr:hypothetical protein [Paludibacteraceae bacterium]
MMILLTILAFVMTLNMDSPSYSIQSGRTVTLMNGSYVYTTMTESYSGSGVVLPELADTADWHFIGWTQMLFHTVYKKPEVIAAGGTYHPTNDITLWAVYQYRPEDPDEYMSEVKTGDYLYVNRQLEKALTGTPLTDGTMNYASANKYDTRLVYHVDFVAPDTAYITHKESNTPIGYSSKKLSAKASPWLVYHSGDETLFYTKIENATYILWLSIDDLYGKSYAGLLKATLGTSPMSLMVAKERPEEAYTCYPDSEMGVHSVLPDDVPCSEYVLPLGNYRLRIRSGHKYLEIEK